MRLDLLVNASSTGPAHDWRGGRGQFALAGALAGATVTLQTLGPDGATWLPLGGEAALTSAGLVNFESPACRLRAAVAGGSPSGLFATAVSI